MTRTEKAPADASRPLTKVFRAESPKAGSSSIFFVLAAIHLQYIMTPMKSFLPLLVAVALLADSALGETVNFDHTKHGHLPRGWVAGITGPGIPIWSVEADASAPSQPNALKQAGLVPSHSYPWCVKKDISLTNGSIQVKFKPLSGKEDRAAGLVWRWQDGNNYYIARANALEDNVIIFRTVKGTREELHRVPMKVFSNQWHTLRVDFQDNHFIITCDGQKAIEWDDDTFKQGGPVGVWTKADSVILFDDFTFEGK